MKKIVNFIILFFIICITFNIFIFKTEVKEAVIFSFDIFINNVFPNLFPFLVISHFLINYGFVEICSKIFSPVMTKLFKINGNSSFIFIMSLITGFPSNAKYTKDLYLKGKIDEDEATKILMFTHFSNPLFIIGIVSSYLNSKYATYILICHYIGNIIIGVLFRNSFISTKKTIKHKRNINSFGVCLTNAINNSINTLLLIFGTITTFLIISFLLKELFVLNPFYQSILSGILEMTQGLTMVGLLNINSNIKAVLMTMFLSFGGISVHMQILSIISDTKIKYHAFLIARLLHAALSGFLISFLI